MNQKIAVLGATGATGTELVTAALRRDHHVIAIARNPNQLATRDLRLEVRRGDVLDPGTLKDAIAGAHVVLSALGARAGRPPTTLYSAGTANLLEAMKAHRRAAADLHQRHSGCPGIGGQPARAADRPADPVPLLRRRLPRLAAHGAISCRPQRRVRLKRAASPTPDEQARARPRSAPRSRSPIDPQRRGCGTAMLRRIHEGNEEG